MLSIKRLPKYTLPLLILFISLSITFWSWYTVQTEVIKTQQTRFESRTERIKFAIQQRMNAYEQVLQGGAALFSTLPTVTRKDWYEYVSHLHIDRHYPGIQGIGFSKYIRPEEKEAHLAQMRAEGFPDYTLRPAGERLEYTAIIYLEPLDRRNMKAIGYDMFSEATRHAAMERARDTGVTAMSGKVTLVQEIDKHKQAGFLMYVPVYRHSQPIATPQQRQAALVGYVYAPFRANDLMQGIMGQQKLGIDFEIYDGTDLNFNTLIYDDMPFHEKASPRLVKWLSLTIGGHHWTLRFTSLSAFEQETHNQTPTVLLRTGLFISFLLFGITWILTNLQAEVQNRQQAEANLLAAKDAAEAANRAKSTFLANMSHELRTPLNGILGYAQIFARDQTLTASQQEGINIIQRSGEYLLTLINDILDLSKIEAGRVELYLTPFNFRDFISSIVDVFKMRAKQKDIAFIYEPLTPLPTMIQGDEKRLRQVLLNLLGNAIKFTEEGGVILKIEYHEHRMRFQIEDTGVGIAPADLERIFLPFQQVGDSKLRTDGTGLGLSITQKLIELMGGELHVESTLNKGSRFWITLDLPNVLDSMPSLSKTTPLILGYAGNPRTILVIDDKRENRMVLIHLLQPLGFLIVEADNGKTGLDVAKNQRPDLIITDLMMPIMDGFEFTKQVKQIPELKLIPVIAASASVFDVHQQHSLQAGCDAFLPKPFRLEMLLELLQKYLQLSWTYEQATSPINLVPASPEIQHFSKVPSPEQAAVLSNLAGIGDIGGILEQIDEMEQQDEQLRPFLEEVRRLARSFEDVRIGEWMKHYL